MLQVNMHEAKTQLSRLVEAVESGERVVIARDGVPVAELIVHTASAPERTGGQWRSLYLVPEDFDAPDPEIEALFGL